MARRAGLTAERVTDAAARLVDTGGWDGLTLARIARDLKVEPPSLYEHLPGLPGVRQALRVRGFRDLLDRSRRAAVGRSGDAAVEALAAATRRFVLEHPGLYDATVRTAEGDTPEVQAVAGELLDVYLAVLEGYGLTGEEAIHALRFVRSALHGFATLESAGGFGRPEEVEVSFQRLVGITIASLRTWSARAR